MKVCKCGSSKFRTMLPMCTEHEPRRPLTFLCLKCYTKYTPGQLKKLKDKGEKKK